MCDKIIILFTRILSTYRQLQDIYWKNPDVTDEIYSENVRVYT